MRGLKWYVIVGGEMGVSGLDDLYIMFISWIYIMVCFLIIVLFKERWDYGGLGFIKV